MLSDGRMLGCRGSCAPIILVQQLMREDVPPNYRDISEMRSL